MDPITHTIDGREYTLPELNTYDKHLIRREYRKSEKAKVLDSAHQAGLDPEATFRALSEFDKDPPVNWVNYVNEIDGMFLIVQISLEKQLVKEGATPKEAADRARVLSRSLTCTDEDLRTMVGKLAHLRRVGDDLPPAKKLPDTATYGDGAAAAEGEEVSDDEYATYAGGEGAEDPTEAAVTATTT